MPKSEENHHGFTEEEQRLWIDTLVKTGKDMDRIFKMQEDRRRRSKEEELKEQWPSTEAARLFTQLGETFTACQKLLEQNPAMERRRPSWPMASGTMCSPCCGTIWKRRTGRRDASIPEAAGGPAGRRRYEGRSIAICTWRWRRRVQRSSTCRRWRTRTQSRWRSPKQRKAWWNGTLEEKVATKLAYVLQVAMSNVGNVNFEPEEEEEEEESLKSP